VTAHQVREEEGSSSRFMGSLTWFLPEVRVCAPSSAPVSPLRSSLVGEGKSGFPPAGPVPPASEGGDGVENNDILCVRP
jgi:hypothetical protein